MSTLEFQICSDIHLEYYDKNQTPETIKFENIISPTYPNSILILAGDIGHVSNSIWQAFMKYVSANWQHIIYVLGNHEYYSNSKDMTKLLNAYTSHLEQYTVGSKILLHPNTTSKVSLSNLSFRNGKEVYDNLRLGGTNIHLLNRNKLKIGDYDILGVTMWTHNEYAIYTQINDFRQIKMHNESGHLKPINLTQYNELHNQDKTWLFANIDPGRKTIIITHFPLTRDGVNHPKYAEQKSSICNYYANEFHNGLLAAYNPCPENQLICIAGHTHFNYDFVKDNIRYIANCYCD